MGRWLVVVALVLPLATCSDHDEGLPEGRWELRTMSYDGTTYDDFLADLADPVTLRADADGVGGSGACNEYGTSLVAGQAFEVDEVESTLRGCGGGLEGFDAAYFEALTEVTTVEETEEGLVLTGEDLRLEYETRGGAR